MDDRPPRRLVLAGVGCAAATLGGLAVFSTAFEPPGTGIRWLLAGLGWLGVLGAAGAVGAARWAAAPVSPPNVRLLACGALAAIPPPVVLWIRPADGPGCSARTTSRSTPPPASVRGLPPGARPGAGVPGLALALVAGRRILLGTLAAGLAGAGAGWLIGLTRWRAASAVAGLAACGFTGADLGAGPAADGVRHRLRHPGADRPFLDPADPRRPRRHVPDRNRLPRGPRRQQWSAASRRRCPESPRPDRRTRTGVSLVPVARRRVTSVWSYRCPSGRRD